jgi:LysR family transcriptional regulator for metE and metH
LVEEYANEMGIVPVRLGHQGIGKQIFIGAREVDTHIDYLKAFIEIAHQSAS